MQREINPIKAAVRYLESFTGDFDMDEYDLKIESMPRAAEDYTDFCRGSSRGKRGYPCTLWRLFHTLTVHCSHDGRCKQAHDAIYAFITNFFGCSECVQNFKMEYGKYPPPNKNSPDYKKKEVMWLWELHNDVNNRLGGDLTEDPEYPKVQVPLFSDCAKCYNTPPSKSQLAKNNHTYIDWNRDEVYQYLMDYYRPYNMPKSPKKWQWPNGNYGFVKTKVGCPEGFVSWKRTHDTENYRPSNAFDGDWERYISSYTGLTGLGNKMSWEFCMKRSADYPTKERLWFPRGDYCIIKSKDHPCPANFTQGWVHWNDEDTNNKNSYYGARYSQPDGEFNHDTKIQFCCRKDGSYRDRIYLPQHFSYTLFPHTVKSCQRIKNKQNKRAWFLFDYEDDQPFSKRVVHSQSWHPFVRNMQDGVRIYVCVYH